MCHPASPPVPPSRSPSRRYRLWELPPHCHCPVLGLCLTRQQLRQLIDKAMPGHRLDDDYALHVLAVSECAKRTPLSERLQERLDALCESGIRALQGCKTWEALACHAPGSGPHDLGGPVAETPDAPGPDLPARFWAAITHPLAQASWQEDWCRHVHLMQHEAGALAHRHARDRQALLRENQVLTRELAKVQQRTTDWLRERDQEIQQLRADLMQARAEQVRATSERQALSAQHAESLARANARAGQAIEPERQKAWEQLHQRLEQRDELIAALRHALRREQARHALPGRSAGQASAASPIPVMSASSGASSHPDLLGAPATQGSPADTPASHPPSGATAEGKRILCVGGKVPLVPHYRRVVESLGATCLHHDGGLESHLSQLEASMAAADLVICQTACLSHNAYWRVKQHCKRTGKPCLYVDNPSPTRLERALVTWLRRADVEATT